MIVQFAHECGQWLAAGKGYLRPIVIEGDSFKDAASAYYAAVEHQKAEEYAMFEAMTARSEMADGTYCNEGDLG